MQRTFDYGNEDNFLVLANFGFDLSVLKLESTSTNQDSEFFQKPIANKNDVTAIKNIIISETDARPYLKLKKKILFFSIDPENPLGNMPPLISDIDDINEHALTDAASTPLISPELASDNESGVIEDPIEEHSKDPILNALSMGGDSIRETMIKTIQSTVLLDDHRPISTVQQTQKLTKKNVVKKHSKLIMNGLGLIVVGFVAYQYFKGKSSPLEAAEMKKFVAHFK